MSSDGELPKIKASPQPIPDVLGLGLRLDDSEKQQEFIRKLEAEDSRPDRRELLQPSFSTSTKKLAKNPFCKCDACLKRREWRALILMNEDPKHPSGREILDELVQKAFQGDVAFVDQTVQKFGMKALQHIGGPVAVTNCETCMGKTNLDTCHHCGKEPWMRSRGDIRTARKDLALVPRYLMMTVLHAACFGGHVLIVDRLLKYGADVDIKDEIGCTPLHWVTCNGHRRANFQSRVLDIWDLLFKYDADVTIADASGKVPIELTVPPNPPVSYQACFENPLAHLH